MEQSARGMSEEMPVGVVLRRRPSASRWAKWRWSVAALLPGVSAAAGRVLRDDPQSGLLEVHAATLTLELHRADVEGYKVSLAMEPPSVFVALRPSEDPDSDEPPEAHLLTASAYEAQDYTDGDGEVVEAVAAPEPLIHWIASFAEAHWRDEPFKKRKRDRYEEPKAEGRGDPRVNIGDGGVFRPPTARRTDPTGADGGSEGGR